MKLKQQPEDFVVEEITKIVPQAKGRFGYYRLDKRGWGTPEAVQAIRRRWNIEPGRLSYGGLKDRHAQTSQYFTIVRGPRRGLQQEGIKVTYLGQVNEPYTSKLIQANQFRIVMRAIPPADVEKIERALEQVNQQGVPNYFDDQRFGSVTEEGEFVGKLLVLGEHERALFLALAAHQPHDRAAQKEEKQILRANWGNWAECKARLPRGHARSLVDYLVSHSRDFRGAFVRMRPEIRSLYLSAYQSHLWNRMLARCLRQNCAASELVWVPLEMGSVPMHRGLQAEVFQTLRELHLPLPSARWHPALDDPRRQIVEDVLREEGLRLEELRVRGIREIYFSKGERQALSLPVDLVWQVADDDRNPARACIELRFKLSPGSYATLIVKGAAQSSGRAIAE